MAWKTVKLPIGEEFQLDNRDWYVKITPISWLPEATMMNLARRGVDIASLQSKMDTVGIEEQDRREGESDEDFGARLQMYGQKQFADMEAMLTSVQPLIRDFLIETIVEWNIEDDAGNVLPIPKVMRDQDSLGLIEKHIPMTVRMYIVNEAQDLQGTETEIPLVNGRQYAPSLAPENEETGEKVLSIV